MSRQLLKSSGIVGAMTFISRILGYVRDMVAAHYFGAGLSYDAFLMAFKIPNFMRRLFAEGAFAQAFVPMLSEYRTTRSELETQEFINKVSGNLTAVLALVTVLGVIGAPILVYMFAPGFSQEHSRFVLASQMLRITFPYLMLISLTAFSGGILNSFGAFAVPSLTPVFLNICMIGTGIYLAPYCAEPVTALAWGVLLGGVVQLLFQIPFLMHLKHLPRPKVDWSDPGVRRILKLMVPALLGVSVNQLNLLVDSAFASFLQVGSVSWLYYSDRLMEFPLGIFGVAIATVVTPNLARSHAANDLDHFSATLDWGLRSVLLVGVPSAIGLFMLAGPLLVTLFQSGHFGARDVLMSSHSLQAYSLGVLGFMLVKVLASGYYARQNIKAPVKIACWIVLIHVLLNAGLIGSLHHAGLALATSIAAMLNATFLLRGLLQSKQYVPNPGWKRYFLQLLCASVLMMGLLYTLTPVLDVWLHWGVSIRIMGLLSIVGLASGVYGLGLMLMGLRLKDIIRNRDKV